MNYFESKKRDGAARIGELKTKENKIETPSLLDKKTEIEYKGSLWFIEKNKEDEGAEIKILGHKISPNSVPRDVAEYLSNQNPIKENQDEKIVSPVIGGGRWLNLRKKFSTEISESKIVTIDALKTLRTKNQLSKIISVIRDNVNEDTALFAPGIASPNNLAFLVYLGIDLFDTTKAKLAASKGKYFNRNETKELKNVKNLLCNCPICSSYEITDLINKKPEEKKKLFIKHNINSLKLELNYIKENIKDQTYREYLESRIKNKPELTGALRDVDKEIKNYQEKRTPIFKRSKVFANTIESLERPEIKRFRERVIDRYNPPNSDLAVLLPCSAKKPYSTSRTHQIIKSVLGEKGNQLIITSPLGLVPRELELIYPAQHYDLPVTGKWLPKEKEMIKGLIKKYFLKHNFEKVVIHVKKPMGEIIKKSMNEINIKSIQTTLNRDPRDKESLKNLKKEVNHFKEVKREQETIKSTLDYQFGEEKNNDRINEFRITGRYPRLRAMEDENQVGEITPNYGSFAMTMEGLKAIYPKNYKVKIGKFIPKGSVLAPGVIKANENIRPNDEVFFEGKKAKGVGRAKMSGFEMEEARRGIAIRVRHLEEIK